MGFGGSEIGYEQTPADTVGRLLGGALDAGLNVIDTAECYPESEELIGRAVSHRRADYYLFTKCGPAPSTRTNAARSSVSAERRMIPGGYI